MPAVMDEEDLIVEQPDDQDAKEEKGKAKGDDEVAKLRKELEARERRIGELEESERAWAKRAGARGDDDEKPKKKESEPEAEIDPEKFVEEFTKNPKGALAKLIKGMGILTKDEIAALTEETANKTVMRAAKGLSKDQQLLRDFPDLNNAKSDLFKRTQEIFTEMTEDDEAGRKNPAVLRAAARAAKAEIERDERKAGKRAESEEDRESRIRRQGERGGRNSDNNDDEGDVGPETSRLMDIMGIKKENRDRVKAGIANAKRTYGEM